MKLLFSCLPTRRPQQIRGGEDGFYDFIYIFDYIVDFLLSLNHFVKSGWQNGLLTKKSKYMYVGGRISYENVFCNCAFRVCTPLFQYLIIRKWYKRMLCDSTGLFQHCHLYKLDIAYIKVVCVVVVCYTTCFCRTFVFIDDSLCFELIVA